MFEAQWPAKWKMHYLIPIFKKGSAFKSSDYRGVHITSNISKTVERVVGKPLIAYLQQNGFSDDQWAFRKQSSARDLALMCMASWTLAICSGKKTGAYLSDISGAFFRVFKLFLLPNCMR